MNNYKIEVYVNPLLYFGSEFSPSGLKVEGVSYQSLMGFLCAPGTDSTIDALVQRYNAINGDPNRLPVAPVEGRLFERLVWPLRHAKGSFVVGNYLGVIALCGLVAEMAAIFAFDLYNERAGSIEWDEARQKGLFGSTFERLGQDRRIIILKTLKVVDDDLSKQFDIVRECRRRYLHFWSADHNALEKDAVECFGAAVHVVASVLGIGFDNGKLLLRDEVFAYLARHGASIEREEKA